MWIYWQIFAQRYRQGGLYTFFFFFTILDKLISVSYSRSPFLIILLVGWFLLFGGSDWVGKCSWFTFLLSFSWSHKKGVIGAGPGNFFCFGKKEMAWVWVS